MSRTTVRPAQGRAQAPVPALRPPLEQAQDAANVFRNTHTIEERWSPLHGRRLVCTGCRQEPRDRGDGRPVACDTGHLSRLLAEVPRQRCLPRLAERPVIPQVPPQWRQW